MRREETGVERASRDGSPLVGQDWHPIVIFDYVDEQAYQWLEYDYGLGRESHEDAYYYGYDDHRNKHDLVHHRKVQHRSHDPEDTVRHAQKADGRMLAP